MSKNTKLNKNKISIILPNYNDSASLNILIRELIKISFLHNYFFNLIIVDDGSTKKINLKVEDKNNISINYLKLVTNMGHQKAIHVGLLYCYQKKISKVIVMDSDGEDKPTDIHKLISKSNELEHSIVVAKRKNRKESFIFRLMYNLYKILFYILTGKYINFGNFCLLNDTHIKKILIIPNSYNHLPASIIKSKFPIVRLPLSKGKRLAGKSKMNFTSLISLGLDAISIYSKEAIIRVIIFTTISSFILFLIAIFILYLRLFSNFLPIGQATSILFFLMIISFVFASICILLSILNTSKLIKNVEISNYKDFVEIEKIIC